ncbi:MAG: DUF5615 family PIN-like protein [Cyanobacteria bacterium J06623_4]
MICFQADADLNQIIVKACRRVEPNIDFQTAAEGRLIGISDPEVLSVAAKLGRVLVTHDRKTMPRHFADRIMKTPSAGVIVVPQSMAVRAVVDDLVLIWMASEAEEWINRIRALPL